MKKFICMTILMFVFLTLCFTSYANNIPDDSYEKQIISVYAFNKLHTYGYFLFRVQ